MVRPGVSWGVRLPRPITLGIVLLAVLVGASAPPAATAQPSSRGRALPSAGPIRLAYYYPPDGSSLESLRANIARFDVVAPHWLVVDEGGRVEATEIREAADLMRASGVVVLPSAVIASPEAGRRILRDPAVTATALDQLVSAVRPWDGLALDFEGLDPEDRDALTTFIHRLGTALRGSGKAFAVALPAKTSDVRTGWAGAYDYARIAEAADLFLVMAYGFRTSATAVPGSTAPLSWVEAVMAYAAVQIAPERLLLGAPLYGYDWNVSRGPPARALRYREVRQLIETTAAAPAFDTAAGSTWFRYETDGEAHEVWYEDDRALAAKLALVSRFGLRGAGVWRLGQEGPEVWGVWDRLLAASAPRPQPEARRDAASSFAQGTSVPLMSAGLPAVWAGDGAEVELSITNPGPGAAAVVVSLLREDGSRTRLQRTVAVGQTDGFRLWGPEGGGDVAVGIEATSPVAAYATTRSADGAVEVTHASAPAAVWIFPDGQSGPGVSTTFAIYNPGDAGATIRVTARSDVGASAWEESTRLGPGERRRIAAPRREAPSPFWTQLVADGPVTVARQTRFVGASQLSSGHAASARRWTLPRAAPGASWSSQLLIVNPGATAVEARVRWTTDGRIAFDQQVSVPSLGRASVQQPPSLANEAAAEVEASGPVVVERSAYERNGVGTFSTLGLAGG